MSGFPAPNYSKSQKQFTGNPVQCQYVMSLGKPKLNLTICQME